MTDPNDSQSPEDQLPDGLVSELRQSDRVPFAIPPERTAKILRDAHRDLATRPTVRPARRWLRVTAVVSSVCAALLLFVVTQLSENDQFTMQPEATVMEMTQPSLHPKDVDENGTVDILDAYLMARLLESAQSGDHWDFNSDGQLNEEDIRLVAFDAVML